MNENKCHTWFHQFQHWNLNSGGILCVWRERCMPMCTACRQWVDLTAPPLWVVDQVSLARFFGSSLRYQQHKNKAALFCNPLWSLFKRPYIHFSKLEKVKNRTPKNRIFLSCSSWTYMHLQKTFWKRPMRPPHSSRFKISIPDFGLSKACFQLAVGANLSIMILKWIEIVDLLKKLHLTDLPTVLFALLANHDGFASQHEDDRDQRNEQDTKDNRQENNYGFVVVGSAGAATGPLVNPRPERFAVIVFSLRCAPNLKKTTGSECAHPTSQLDPRPIKDTTIIFQCPTFFNAKFDRNGAFTAERILKHHFQLKTWFTLCVSKKVSLNLSWYDCNLHLPSSYICWREKERQNAAQNDLFEWAKKQPRGMTAYHMSKVKGSH